MSSNDYVDGLGAILFIGAHPDDETWAAGGLLSTATSNRQNVDLLCLTQGGRGQTADPDRWPTETLKTTRRAELQFAASVVGATNVEVLDYDDGSLQNSDKAELSTIIQRRIKKINPDTIITFSGFGLTGHPDHRAVHEVISDVLQNLQDKPRFLCAIESIDIHADAGGKLDSRYHIYMDDVEGQRILAAKADLVFELPKEALDIKMLALSKHQSQYSRMLKDSEPLLRQMLSTECYIQIKN